MQNHIFKSLCVFLVVFCFIATAFTVFAWTLSDTGQHTYYDKLGNILDPCRSPGRPVYGQDADYQCAEPSFRGNENGTVTDLNTDLVWQQSDDGVERTWNEAISYCEELELGGKTDWRLPNARELFSITDGGRCNPAIDPAFECRSSLYWAREDYIHDGCYQAWWVDFRNGNVCFGMKDDRWYVRCVRNGP